MGVWNKAQASIINEAFGHSSNMHHVLHGVLSTEAIRQKSWVDISRFTDISSQDRASLYEWEWIQPNLKWHDSHNISLTDRKQRRTLMLLEATIYWWWLHWWHMEKKTRYGWTIKSWQETESGYYFLNTNPAVLIHLAKLSRPPTTSKIYIPSLHSSLCL